jgi:hypothetical protein
MKSYSMNTKLARQDMLNRKNCVATIFCYTYDEEDQEIFNKSVIQRRLFTSSIMRNSRGLITTNTS